MLKALQQAVDEAGGMRAFARMAEVDVSHVSRALNGGAAVGPALLAAAGLERVVTYRKVST